MSELCWPVVKIKKFNCRLENNRVTSDDLLGSRDVIGHVTIQLAVGDFLWVVHCDHASILHRYENMASQKLDRGTHARKHARMDAQVILYSGQTKTKKINILHDARFTLLCCFTVCQ